MGVSDPTYMSLSRQVLDAATQLDKRLRNHGAPLDKVSSLVDVLSDPGLRGDLLFQNDLWRALRRLGSSPTTVDQLNAAAEGELRLLRSALAGDVAASRKGLEFCLALHETVLRASMRTCGGAPGILGFGPMEAAGSVAPA